MRKFLVGVVALASGFAFAPPAEAHAPLTNARLCRFASLTDPQVEDTQTGQVDGGPILIGAQTGYLTCTVQVNEPLHSGNDACAVVGPEMTGAVAAAGTCSYASELEDNVYLCTQVDIVSPVQETWYWHVTGTLPGEGEWSQDPNSACGLATTVVLPDGREIDPFLCPVLALIFPPEGDIVLPDPIGLFWDCPEYEEG